MELWRIFGGYEQCNNAPEWQVAEYELYVRKKREIDYRQWQEQETKRKEAEAEQEEQTRKEESRQRAMQHFTNR